MYESHFGLTEQPFNLTPDPRFIYFSRQHEHAFSTLVYGVEYRKGFVALTGEIGAGKTTLCRRFLNEIKPKAKTSLILNPTLSDTQLLSSIVDDFGIEPKQRNKQGYFNALNKFLLETSEEGKAAVLVIDEAQNLNPKTLEQIRLLSNLETEKQKLIQIILIGQPELRRTLLKDSLTQLRQRITLLYHLTALDESATASYIRHRLQVAGATRDLFAEACFNYIYMKSRGIPRLINNLCDKALLSAYVAEQAQVHLQALQGVCESEQHFELAV